MTDASALKPKQLYVLALLESKAVLSLIAFLTGLGTMWGAQQFTAPAKPLRIPAADFIAAPAPTVNVDVAPIVKAIENIRNDLAVERAQRLLKSGRSLK